MNDKPSISIYFHSVVIAGLLSALLYFLATSSIKPTEELANISTTIKKEIEKIEKTNYQSGNFSNLTTSPFQISIIKGGENIFWNYEKPYHPNQAAIYHKRIKKDSFIIDYKLRLLNDKLQLLTDAFPKTNTEHSYKYSKSITPYHLLIGDKTIYLEKNNIAPHNLWYILFIIFLSLFYLLTNLFLFNRKLTLGEWLISIVSTIILRAILYWVSYFEGWETYTLFQKVSDTSFLNNSIADYCLNILTLGILLQPIAKLNLPHKTGQFVGNLIKIITGFLIGLIYNYYCTIAKGFILSDKINLNVEKALTLEWQSIIVLLGLIIGQLILFTFSIIAIKYIKNIEPKGNILIWTGLGIILSAGPVFHLLPFNPIILSAFLIAFIIMIDLFLDSKDKNIIWLIWWMVVISGFTACLIYYLGHNKEILYRKGELDKIYQKSLLQNNLLVYSIDSILEESDMSLIISELPYPTILDQEDVKSFIQSFIPDSLKSNFLVNRVLIFDQLQNPVIATKDFRYFDLQQNIKMSKRLQKNIFYNPIYGQYQLLYEIPAVNHPTGTYQVFISLKKEKQFTYPLNEDHVLLKNEEVLIPATYNIPEGLIPKIKNEGVFYYDANLIVVKKLPNNLVVFSQRKVASLMRPISLFSYVFTIIGIIIFLIASWNKKFSIITPDLEWNIVEKTSLRSRIQLTLIALIMFSFISIGFLTAIYFKNILKDNNVKNQNTVLNSLLEEINADIQSSNNLESALNTVNEKLISISPLISSPFEFYDQDGNQLLSNITATSSELYRLPYPIYQKYQDENSSNYANYQGEDRVIPFYYKNEQVPFAFLTIRNDQKRYYTQSILDFLSTLLNVYVFLFLLAGAVAIAISNNITKPLTTLTDKFRGFRLGKRNEPLEWERDDEIGTLIKDYNTLVIKLEESAQIIAKTERDTAWREMAKQVAHEIKNPLTPMKLSIQYLQRSLAENDPNKEVLLKRVSQTLLEQINNLSEIANEFSNFAKMPQSNNEKIIINEIVEAVHDLFRKRDDMDISLEEPINELYVFADRGQLVRILNNLVKNAIQAIPEGRRGKINISLYKQNHKAVVKVSDNGIGIPDDMKKKVFTPNFTTKSSGTGLGLAISANIIEGFNGKIYFDTKPGKGTDFYIEIPLMRLEDTKAVTNRIVLD